MASTASAAAGASACALVTESDVSAILGVPIARQGFRPTAGAGSVCNGNFTAANKDGAQEQVLMVQDYADLTLFDHPETLKLNAFTPKQDSPALGSGARAKMFTATAATEVTMKSLMIEKNGKLLVLQTFNKLKPLPPQLTTSQLVALGKVVAARM